MKLTELDPRWSASGHGRMGQGIVFLCPKCKDHFLAVWFANPVDGKEPFVRPGLAAEHRWTRVGDDFETLTLTPSISVVAGCKWHGFITNGDVKTV
jgi:Family of unknown function (DUF6527)